MSAPTSTATATATRAIDVRNPVTGEIVGTFPVMGHEEVRAAVERARLAQIPWGAMEPRQRMKLVNAWRQRLWDHQQELLNTIWKEIAKPYAAAFAEIMGVDNLLAYYSNIAHKTLKPRKRRSLIPLVLRGEVHYRPYGVVGVISPWNYPYLLPLFDVSAALIAGNAVVLKPSEVSPMSSTRAFELAHEAGIPHDLLQVVYGDGSTGSALIDYVDYVSFTGSTATGRKVAVQAAQRLIPYSLELGGKDPAIVLSDADLDMAAVRVITGAWENAGQACLSIERVYVEEPVYDAFLNKVQEYARQFKFGADINDYMGTMINEREVIRTEEHVRDAVEKGAKVVLGGKRRPDLGPRFFEPTVLVDVNHDMLVMQEETFGPLMPIMKVKNAEEAISLANDTSYGLGANVFSKNLRRAKEIAARLNAGESNINRFVQGIATPAVPSGGMRQSGIGRRNGPEGLLKYTQPQALMTDTLLAQKPDLNVLDRMTLFSLLTLRRIRRVLPFI
jgi:acyl-CoA reductase-like NAD-dependent aldehyde dehydrogenase